MSRFGLSRRIGKPLRRNHSRVGRFETLEDRRLLAQVALELSATDLAGDPLPSNQVVIGNDFLLRASVRDLELPPTGVFAAYMDVGFSNPNAFSVVYSETQRVTFSNKTTGGTYQLTLGTEQTPSIFFGSDLPGVISNMQSAIESFSSVGVGNVEVTHEPFIDDRNPSNDNPFRFDVKFINGLFETDVENMTGDATGLTVSAGTPSIVLEEIAQGVPEDEEAFRRSFTPGEDYPHGLTAEDGDRDPDTGELIDANVFSEVGSFDGVGFAGGTEGDDRLLWSVRLNADALGSVTFIGSPADNPVLSGVLVFGTEDPVATEDLVFNDTTVTIVADVPSDGTIYGQKFFDADGDGVRDDTEEGVDGVTIELVDPATGNVIDSIVTATIESDSIPGTNPVTEKGLYSFTVAAGIYEIREASANPQSFPGAGFRYIVEVKSGQEVGVRPAQASIHCGGTSDWVGSCPSVHQDTYVASALISLDLPDNGTFDGVIDETLLVSGTVVVAANTPLSGTGSEFATEIVSMTLRGESSLVGPVVVTTGDGVGNFINNGPLHAPGIVRQLSPGSQIASQQFTPVWRVEFQGQTLTTQGAFTLQGLASRYVPYHQGFVQVATFVQLVDDLLVEKARLLQVRMTPQYGVDFGNQVPVKELDFGDAPDPGFATLLPGGASHVLGSGLFLGSQVDKEDNGQPNSTATGDEDNGSDDEDGVRQVSTSMSITSTSTTSAFQVIASKNGKLDAWIDFNGDGKFDHPAEHLRQGVSIDLSAGSNLVPYSVPSGATAGDTFARFRISSVGGLMPGGEAADGEVEDYQHTILDGDATASVFVELFAGDVEITTDANEVTVQRDGVEIFRARGDAVAALQIHGTSGANVVGIGDLTSAFPTAVPFSFDGKGGSDTLRLTASNQTLDLTDANNAISNLEEIDIIGASPNQLILDSASVVAATDFFNTLLIRHDEDDTVDYLGTWEVQTPIFEDGSQKHVLRTPAARIETVNTRPWQHPFAATDVNFKLGTTSLDALLIINFLRINDSVPVNLATPTSAAELPEFYYDVNGSGSASSLDALLVINFLRDQLNTKGELIRSTLIGPLTPIPSSRGGNDRIEEPTLKAEQQQDVAIVDFTIQNIQLSEIAETITRTVEKAAGTPIDWSLIDELFTDSDANAFRSIVQ